MRTAMTVDRMRRLITVLAAVVMLAGSGALAGTASGGQASPPATGPQLSKFEVLPTVFLVREGEALLQVLDVTVENSGPEVEAQVLGAL
ncbi:MAG: hypothetical protein OEW05_08905, partial [Candidatus Aminicenantes bacterium]|nr:hypothetical protein [Candidatus Aminicenantes bacterium]